MLIIPMFPTLDCEDGSDGHNNYSCMQYAMEKLQERFTRTMAEVAELSDEKQRLEHLVLQLQGETETIGTVIHLVFMIKQKIIKMVLMVEIFFTL